MKKLNLNLFDFGLISLVILINIITIFTGSTNTIGVVSSIVGVCCVVLMAKGHKYSCYFSITNNILYGYLSFNAHLYGEMLLNVYFLLMSVLALVSWNRHSQKDGVTIESRRLNKKQIAILSVVTIIGIVLFALFLNYVGDRLPVWDSISTVLAVVSMYLFVNRYTEQWFLWIIVNLFTLTTWIISVQKGVPLASAIPMIVMWSAYVINSIRGYLVWNSLEK